MRIGTWNLEGKWSSNHEAVLNDSDCDVQGGVSRDGRNAVNDALVGLGLRAETRDLPSRLTGLRTIDHIAVPESWSVTEVCHVPVSARLSDHDVYWAEVDADASHR